MSVTGVNIFNQSNGERKDSDGDFQTYNVKSKFSIKGFKDFGAHMGEAISGPCKLKIFSQNNILS